MSERIIPPIRTELEYAPTDKDRLADELGGFVCARELQCRIQNCYTDKHHMIFGQDLTDQEIENKSAPNSKQEICRWKHQQVHVTWKRSQPTEGETIEWSSQKTQRNDRRRNNDR